ncbi:MAG TPA: GatB/YqeY domain-containing protein [Longimicrobiaceae bacterium]|nr:GatB/YqeY domain-containing protein [Longimicrobiaceae bacterium]
MADTALKDQVRADLNAARRERDKLRTTTLTTFLAEIRNREIELGRELKDEDVQGLLTTAIKRRREAADQMRAGGRPELAEKEDREALLLQAYLPPQLGETEVRQLVRAAVEGGAKDLGSVMKAVMPQVKGRFEGRELNRIVREELGG